MAQIDLKNATVIIRDGSTPVNSVTIKVGEGNLSFTEKVNRTYTLDRGALSEVRNGDESPLELKFDMVWEYYKGGHTSDGVASPIDALKKANAASTWTSSDSDTCRPYAVDIVVRYVPDCTGDEEEITFADFRYESLAFDLKAGSISCDGKCNVTAATAARNAQSSGS